MSGGTAHEVLIVDTGVANIASMLAAFERLGARPRLIADPVLVAEAPRLVLPGVGSFGSARATLDEHDLVAPLVTRLADPAAATLCVCVGMQLLFERSEESADAKGLGRFRGAVTQFPDRVMRPQFGWNRVAPRPGCRWLEPGYAYFANSYRVAMSTLESSPFDPAVAFATTEHGGDFVSALEHGALLACQFHPELSGAWGMRLLGHWLEASAC